MGALLCCCSLSAWGGNTDRESNDAAHHQPTTYIEQKGDSYIIHVDALNPDSEMTLMDVLMLCPEMVTSDGKTLADNFVLGIDNIDVFLDQETFLQQVRASEVSSITIYTSPSVSQGMSGSEMLVDITFKDLQSRRVHGKAAVDGNTYGNGKVYADFTTHQHHLDVKGYAMANQHYSKVNPLNENSFTDRNLAENTHLDLKWHISPKDYLNVKVFQQYTDVRKKYDSKDNIDDEYEKEHTNSLIASYVRTLNDKNATLSAESGIEYVNTKSSGITTREIQPYLEVEWNTPLLTDDLWMMAGVNVNYENFQMQYNRLQQMQSSLYLQFNYAHGPWVITVGDRLTRLSYWNHFHATENDVASFWSHHRYANTMVANLGYRFGQHYLQGGFQKEFYEPEFNDFYRKVMGRHHFNTNYATNNVWKAEARYTYQQRHFTLFGKVYHKWFTDLPTPQIDMTGVKASCTWHKGNFRLTAGATYCHVHVHGNETESPQYDNHFSLRMAPTLLLGKGFRLSSVLIYNGRQSLLSRHPHLIANIKVNKDLGRHCNVFADFHDLAGMPTIVNATQNQIYHHRALTLGLTYRF